MPTKKGYTRKPCPGCGESSYREVNSVCVSCEQALKQYWKVNEAIKEQNSNLIYVGYAPAAHWNSYIHAQGKDEEGERYGSIIRDRFFNMLELLATPSMVHATPEFTLMGKTESGTKTVLLPRPLAEAIKNLWDILRPAFKAEYETGKKDGKNLLMGLAKGEISPNDWMEEENEQD